MTTRWLPTCAATAVRRLARRAAAAAGEPGSPTCHVEQFHRALGLPVADAAREPFPTRLAADRLALLQEEVDELALATRNGDLPAVADALADIVYITYGTALSLGVDLDRVLAAVHKSNMAKRVPGPARLGAHGKVAKPAGWKPPDIAAITGGRPAPRARRD